MDHSFLLKILSPHFEEIKDLQVFQIQQLWNGYGFLNRVSFTSNQKPKSFIFKLIQFPGESHHPRGWSSNFAHKRKEKSYQVECYWYQNYNHPHANSYFPTLLASGNTEGVTYLILEDLKDKGFKPKTDISWEETKLCLRWLANFHKQFLGTRPQGLWDRGTYWHLETRPDELEVMTDMELKAAAPLIDQKLNQAKFETFVHGDAKLANFLFNSDSCAAVDFQYIGGGVGVKDVAYFLSSVYSENELQSYEAKCLDYYFQCLDAKEVESEWRDLYPYAWCDFYRFLQGWCPDHYKVNKYSQQMRDKILKDLK